MDGMLSQEEINALLSGLNSGNMFDTTETETLTNEEKDAIGEVSNISMGTAATALSALVNQRVVITTPVVSYASWEDLADNYDKPCVFIQIYYKEGLDGNNILILKESDVKIITDLMMGGDGTNAIGELSELHLSAIGEAMNQMMGAASTSISSMLEKRVDISPPIANVVDLNGSINREDIAPFLLGQFVKVSFKMIIGDLVDSELMQLYPFELARDLYKQFTKDNYVTSYNEPQVTPTVASNQQAMNHVQQAMNHVQQPMNHGQQTTNVPTQQSQSNDTMSGGSSAMNVPIQDINVMPAQFQPFVAPQHSTTQPENIGLIMDVPLEVTVELGRTNKSIKEILEFAPGTIIELNKLAGEPIDVLVNGKYVAKGEVVVIEESFGIRVTEIVK